MVRPYTFDDIVNTLNQIVPYDWRTFWLERLQSKAPHGPLGGIENGGYRLVYNSTPSQWMQLTDPSSKNIDARFSVGLFLKDNGTVADVILNGPAAKAGFAPGMLVIAVNGRKFSGDIFRQAIAESKNSPLDFIVENAEYYKVLHVDYHDGPKFPHLERVPGKPALFDDIIKPLAH